MQFSYYELRYDTTGIMNGISNGSDMVSESEQSKNKSDNQLDYTVTSVCNMYICI